MHPPILHQAHKTPTLPRPPSNLMLSPFPSLPSSPVSIDHSSQYSWGEGQHPFQIFPKIPQLICTNWTSRKITPVQFYDRKHRKHPSAHLNKIWSQSVLTFLVTRYDSALYYNRSISSLFVLKPLLIVYVLSNFIIYNVDAMCKHKIQSCFHFVLSCFVFLFVFVGVFKLWPLPIYFNNRYI